VKSWLSRGRAALADILGPDVLTDRGETEARNAHV